MDVRELADRFPLLWHVTFAGGWSGISRHGLRPATDLLDSVGRSEEATRLRPSIVRLHTSDGTVVLRDQVPNRKDPAPYLIDVSVGEWWDLINRRAYLFPERASADKLLNAYISQGHTQEVIELDTLTLLGPIADCVEVTTVNAGVFPRSKEPSRGRATFVPLVHFAGPARAVHEVTVTAAVPVDARVVRAVHRHTPGHEPVLLWPER